MAPPGSNPFPPKSAAPRPTYRACGCWRGQGGTWHSGGRKSGVAAPQLPTPGQRVSRQSPRWRSGATANGEPHAPRSARPAPPARPPASAQRSAASSASPSEPPWRRRLPGRPGLAWPLRLLRAAQPHPFPPTALGAARNFFKKRNKKKIFGFFSFFFFFFPGRHFFDVWFFFCSRLALTCGAAGRAGGGGARGWSRRARVES